MLQILNTVAAHRAQPGATDLKQVLSDAAHVIRRRSLIFVVSDFITAPGWEKALTPWRSRHDVIAVRLTDPLETPSADLGFIHSRMPNPGSSCLSIPMTGAFASASRPWPPARTRRCALIFEKAGVDVVELGTDDEVLDAMIRFAAMRKQFLRRSA